MSYHWFRKGKATSDDGVGAQAKARKEVTKSASEVPELSSPSNGLASEYDELSEYGKSPKGVIGDLQLVYNLIQIYNLHTKYDGALPTAGNKELMAAMFGGNRYKERFVSEDFGFLNEKREIIDRWGNALVFHFENAESPEIRSKGEDGIGWTEDDIILSY